MFSQNLSFFFCSKDLIALLYEEKFKEYNLVFPFDIAVYFLVNISLLFILMLSSASKLFIIDSF